MYKESFIINVNCCMIFCICYFLYIYNFLLVVIWLSVDLFFNEYIYIVWSYCVVIGYVFVYIIVWLYEV